MIIGFVGVGDQGLPIATRLSGSTAWSLVVWARRTASLDPLRGGSTQFAGSLGELGALADVVGICVSDDAAVEQVVRGLVPTMRPGSTVLVHSTVLPDTVQRLAAWTEGEGVALLDAPVSGGSDAALEGRMAVMVGGPAAVLESVRPILEHFATTVSHLGDVGAGAAAKIVNNVLMMANGGVLLDALQVATTAGLDEAVLLDALGASSGGSYVLGRIRRHISPNLVAHVAALLRKDLDLFEQMTDQRSSLLMASATRYVEHLVARTASTSSPGHP